MNIILTEDVESLGSAGDLVKVKDGFARNYLIPGGKAMVATTQNVKLLEHQKQLVQARLNKLKREAELLARKIEEVSCTVAKQAGEEDKIFGAVTAADIQGSLAHEGIEIDRRKIQLDEPLKSLGIFTVPVKLHQEVTAQLKVWVVKE
ncbi:MAG: 50S ribosomal protein L9 [Deltaproteobacteria bacterium]|nr:50S ribosomal protein L9 [Deltaproteobacteria bacterium]